MKSNVKQKQFYIRINDIFDDLSEENKRLNNELMFANNCLNILNKFKIILKRFYENYETFIKLEDKQHLIELEDEFNSIIEEQNEINEQKTNKNVKNGQKVSEDINEEINSPFDETNDSFEDQNSIDFNDNSDQLFEENQDSVTDSDGSVDQKTVITNNVIENQQKLFITEISVETNSCESSDETIKTKKSCAKSGAKIKKKTELNSDSDYQLSDGSGYSTDPKTFSCNLCEYSTNTRRCLKQHILSMHSNEEIRVECDFEKCHKIFKDMTSMKTHKRLYHSTQRLVCEWPGCGQTYKTKRSLKEHKRTHFGVKQFKCTLEGCGKAFVMQKGLSQHKMYHRKQYVCQWHECGQCFGDKRVLSVHMNKHQNIKPFKCTFNGCPNDYFSQRSLNRHLQSVHNNVRQKCEKVSQDMDNNNEESESDNQNNCDILDHSDNEVEDELGHNGGHNGRHNGGDSDGSSNEKTDITNDLIESQQNLNETEISVKTNVYESNDNNIKTKKSSAKSVTKKSIKRKTKLDSDTDCQWIEANVNHLPNENTFLCNICDYKTKCKYTLKKHITYKHMIRERKFECDFEKCHKTFKDITAVKVHKRLYHSTQRLICEWPGCDQTYKTKSGLKEHQRTHIGVKGFKCEVEGCGKAFIMQKGLSQHKMYHRKQFVCEWPGCDQSFGDKRTLASHQNKHQNIKAFKCTFSGCPQQFYSDKGLASHLKRVHQKKFVCDWPGCDQSFGDKRSLTAHQNKHQDIKAFKCTFIGCSQQFYNNKGLNKHLKRVHQKMFVCEWPECDQRFENHTNLSSHMNRHQNIRPFKCSFNGCPKDYFSDKGLDRHLKNSHKNESIV